MGIVGDRRWLAVMRLRKGNYLRTRVGYLRDRILVLTSVNFYLDFIGSQFSDFFKNRRIVGCHLATLSLSPNL